LIEYYERRGVLVHVDAEDRIATETEILQALWAWRMIIVKTPDEMARMRASGQMAARVRMSWRAVVSPG
jgi:hypothetical protein